MRHIVLSIAPERVLRTEIHAERARWLGWRRGDCQPISRCWNKRSEEDIPTESQALGNYADTGNKNDNKEAQQSGGNASTNATTIDGGADVNILREVLRKDRIPVETVNDASSAELQGYLRGWLNFQVV